jgi:hypothetical protein
MILWVSLRSYGHINVVHHKSGIPLRLWIFFQQPKAPRLTSLIRDRIVQNVCMQVPPEAAQLNICHGPFTTSHFENTRYDPDARLSGNQIQRGELFREHSSYSRRCTGSILTDFAVNTRGMFPNTVCKLESLRRQIERCGT